ncbi:MAG TPA: outer membrane lipoprotein carrier protein LolA [Elusimicrobiota bacterium]|nr:outer membrane lipoprotein carrier protein LolA [Elusimicrobiota bacterium]
MRALLLAVLLVPAAAHAKKVPAKVAVSTAAAGSDLPAYAASTAPLTLDLIAARFGELDAKMNTLKADFTQYARMEGSDTVQQVEGDVLFKKPDLMRLTHRLPEKQVVVSDGTWLWVYRPSTNQVIQKRLEDWRKSEPLAKGLLDFGRSAELLKRYDAALSTVSAPGADGYRTFVVTLKPKSAERASGDADFTLTLKASTKDYFPYEASLNVGRASIRSTFSNVRLNPVLPDDTFRFSPPPGADVFAAPTQP